jgi:transposase-like protein
MVTDDELAETKADAKDARTTDRMSVRSTRVEVITRGERWRRWSIEQKREIAAESLEAGVSPITVARRYGISGGLFYTWRRRLLEGALGAVAHPMAKFARVEVMAVPAQPGSLLPEPERQSFNPHPVSRPEGMIEIALPDGVSVAGGALRRLLAALARR